MRAFRPVLALLCATGLASSCGAEPRAPAKEALGAAFNVTSLSGERAQKKDCWVRCGAGYVCNLENGRCEFGECLARCEVAWHCVHDPQHGDYCVRDSDGKGTPGSLHVSPAPKATLPTDAGTLDAAFVGSADAATDASETLALIHTRTTSCGSAFRCIRLTQFFVKTMGVWRRPDRRRGRGSGTNGARGRSVGAHGSLVLFARPRRATRSS